MAKLSGSIDVSNTDIGDKITDAIDDGVDDATDEIARGITRTGKNKIRADDAVWRHEMLEAFSDVTINLSDRTVVMVNNNSDHAPYQEHGVSGTKNKRETPYSYDSKMPPLESIIPWVRDNLVGWQFDPNNSDGKAE